MKDTKEDYVLSFIKCFHMATDVEPFLRTLSDVDLLRICPQTRVYPCNGVLVISAKGTTTINVQQMYIILQLHWCGK